MGALVVRHEPASAAVVRKHMVDDLAAKGVSADSIDEVVLVASELVGNAVRHARPSSAGTIDVSWDLDDTGVIVRVADTSGDSPHLRSPTPDEPGGRGLTIIAAMADDWGYQRTPGGKQVWARVSVGGSGTAVARPLAR